MLAKKIFQLPGRESTCNIDYVRVRRRCGTIIRRLPIYYCTPKICNTIFYVININVLLIVLINIQVFHRDLHGEISPAFIRTIKLSFFFVHPLERQLFGFENISVLEVID